MANYWERREEQRRDWEKYTRLPLNRRLKHIAIVFIILAITLQFLMLGLMIFFPEKISDRLYLILKGTTGVCALIFAVLIVVLAYRINKAAINDRWR